MRHTQQQPLAISTPLTNYPAYMSSPFRPSSSQTNFYPQTSTPKATIVMNPFNQLYHSRNPPSHLQYTNTPQKSHQMPLQTQSESKAIKSFNKKVLKERVESNSKRWSNLMDDEKYLVGLEGKMKVLLQENDKLLALVDEKSRELKEYQEIERKIHVILAENTRLNQILQTKEQENESSLILHQNQMIEKQNIQIEQLAKEIEQIGLVDEENQNLKAKEEQNNRRIKDILKEKEGLIRKNEKLQVEINDYEETLSEKIEINKKYEKDLTDLVGKNEKFRLFFDEKQEENRKKLSILIESSENLNNLIDELSKENKRILEEKDSENHKKENYKKKFISLLEINERLNELSTEHMSEKEQNILIHSKIEELIQTNQNLENAFHEKISESKKYQALYEEFRVKLEGNNEKSIRIQTTNEEIEVLMEQFEALKRENIELYEKNNELLNYQQEFTSLFEENQRKNNELMNSQQESENLFEENQRLNNFIQEFELREKEWQQKNEILLSELEKQIQIHQEIKQELVKVLGEKEEISGNLHEKCMILLDENTKLQQIIENKDQDIHQYAMRVQELEEELDDKINNLNEYQQKNENICQEFVMLKEEFEKHRVNSKEEGETAIEENLLKLQKELEILKGQNSHWKIMNETRDKEILKLYDLLKTRKQENLGVLKENQELKEEILRVKTRFQRNGDEKSLEGEIEIEKLMEERDLQKNVNENMKREIESLREQFENSQISAEYYKMEYENMMKITEETKECNGLEI